MMVSCFWYFNEEWVFFEDFKHVYSYNIVNVAIVCWVLQSILPTGTQGGHIWSDNTFLMAIFSLDVQGNSPRKRSSRFVPQHSC
jgi:hypothetical protein